MLKRLWWKDNYNEDEGAAVEGVVKDLNHGNQRREKGKRGGGG